MASPVWKRTVSFIIILYFCLLDVEIYPFAFDNKDCCLIDCLVY